MPRYLGLSIFLDDIWLSFHNSKYPRFIQRVMSWYFAITCRKWAFPKVVNLHANPLNTGYMRRENKYVNNQRYSLPCKASIRRVMIWGFSLWYFLKKHTFHPPWLSHCVPFSCFICFLCNFFTLCEQLLSFSKQNQLSFSPQTTKNIQQNSFARQMAHLNQIL